MLLTTAIGLKGGEVKGGKERCGMRNTIIYTTLEIRGDEMGGVCSASGRCAK
jgi:hypothetical protein